MSHPLISVVIASRNHAHLLLDTLKSIYQQRPPFEFEVILIDNGSEDHTPSMCKRFPRLKYIQCPLGNVVYNPAKARNEGVKHARGDILICQSDDVIHALPNTIEFLTTKLNPGQFLIANCYVYDKTTGIIKGAWVSVIKPKPLFFLGSLWREDYFKIGGNDEEFIFHGSEDRWFGDCLVRGAHLECVNVPIIGLHQNHPRVNYNIAPSLELHRQKRLAAESGAGAWIASGGPWPLFIHGKSYYDVLAERRSCPLAT